MQNTDVVYFPIRDLFVQHQQTYRDLSGQHVYYIPFLYTYACSFSFIQGKWLLSISTRAQVCDKNTFVAFHNFQRRHMLALRSDLLSFLFQSLAIGTKTKVHPQTPHQVRVLRATPSLHQEKTSSQRTLPLSFRENRGIFPRGNPLAHFFASFSSLLICRSILLWSFRACSSGTSQKAISICLSYCRIPKGQCPAILFSLPLLCSFLSFSLSFYLLFWLGSCSLNSSFHQFSPLIFSFTFYSLPSFLFLFFQSTVKTVLAPQFLSFIFVHRCFLPLFSFLEKACWRA